MGAKVDQAGCHYRHNHSIIGTRAASVNAAKRALVRDLCIPQALVSTATIPTAVFIEMPIGWIGLRMTTLRHQSLNHPITIVVCSLSLSLSLSRSIESTKDQSLINH